MSLLTEPSRYNGMITSQRRILVCRDWEACALLQYRRRTKQPKQCMLH